MEILIKNPETGRWEKTQSPESILPPSFPKKSRLKIWITPNWPMIIMFIVAIPCAGYLVEKPEAPTVIVPIAQLESQEQIELIVDSIFRSIETGEQVFSKPVDNSRFKEWMHYLKAREGFMAKPYYCPAGYLTVGYGHNVSAHGWSKAAKYMQDGKITYRAATQLLYQDVEEEIIRIRKLAPHLNRDQTLAVASLFANCGSGKIIGKKNRPSKFWRDVIRGRIPDFSPYCRYRSGGKFVTAPNLVAARSFEQSLFEGGSKPVKIYDGKRLVPVSFTVAARHYQSAVISRDILPSKKRRQYQ